jgi:hypothetical protein
MTFYNKINLFQALATFSLTALSHIQAIAACEPAVYSLSNKQLTFKSLAVEMYQPYTNVPDGTYTLCTGKGGPILMNYRSLEDFSFPYKRVVGTNEPPQEVECVQKITSADVEKCYPTYSGKDGRLSFPVVKVPWRAILPLGTMVEVGGNCYEAILDQGTLRPAVFTLISAIEKICQ